MTAGPLPDDIEKALLMLSPLDAQLAATLKVETHLVISALLASLNILWVKKYQLSAPFKEMNNLLEKDPSAWLSHGSDIRDDGGRAADVQQIILGRNKYLRKVKWECDLYQRQAQMCVNCADGWRKRLRQILIQFYGRKRSCLVVVEKMHGKHFALMKSGNEVEAHIFEPDKEARMPVSMGTMPCDLDCLPILKVAAEFRWAIDEDMDLRRRRTREKKKRRTIHYPPQLDVSAVVSPEALCIHVPA